MSFSHKQLEALENAIAFGTLEVRIGDKLVKYQTTSELIKARDLLRDQLECISCTRSSLSSFAKD